ncbi:hypothetical protein Clacol_004559 [Clathrus columnatus]|uniref:Peptidase S33 tripeptidyl aminopeptidase-like C-terminal domain-containing protein n=1 Tax=Clathrus columnatus TaxID=1419009 RepID=A0AAV5ACG1_9AGAM|nr:hypothetical protein Clacol_004559 [Clathrus columnatus]
MRKLTSTHLKNRTSVSPLYPGALAQTINALIVPLDYANPSEGSATLALARLRSQSPNRKGTILTNPGGPSGSGVDFVIARAGDLISNVTNGEFDVLSWDPRGVNHSRPAITCGFSTAESFQDFFANTIIQNGIEARGNFTDEDDLVSFFSKVNETDNLIVEMGQKCVEANDFLQFVGTIDYIATEQSLEVTSSIEHIAATLNDAEDTLLGFAETCVQAGPANCSLAQANSTGPEIFSELVTLIDTAYNLTKQGLNNVTSFEIRDFLWGLMADPVLWSSTGVSEIEHSESVLESEANTLVSRSQRRSFSGGGIPPSSNTFIDPSVSPFVAELAINCVDSIDQPDITTQILFETVVNVTQQISPIFGEVLIVQAPIFCHRFPTRAVERFTGPFNHTLAFPILVIGNKADPITPFQNAQNVANSLGESARLIQQDGFGHTSIAMNSDCTQSIIRDYFVSGALPENGVICPTDQALFPPNITVASVNALVV